MSQLCAFSVGELRTQNSELRTQNFIQRLLGDDYVTVQMYFIVVVRCS